jgi:hypothetical protein
MSKPVFFGEHPHLITPLAPGNWGRRMVLFRGSAADGRIFETIRHDIAQKSRLSCNILLNSLKRKTSKAFQSSVPHAGLDPCLHNANVILKAKL